MDAFQILERPTPGDIDRQLKTGSGTLRAVRDTRSGDIYTWDAATALHEEAIRYLGLGEFAENIGQVHSVAEFRRLMKKGKR